MVGRLGYELLFPFSRGEQDCMISQFVWQVLCLLSQGACLLLWVDRLSHPAYLGSVFQTSGPLGSGGCCGDRGRTALTGNGCRKEEAAVVLHPKNWILAPSVCSQTDSGSQIPEILLPSCFHLGKTTGAGPSHKPRVEFALQGRLRLFTPGPRPFMGPLAPIFIPFQTQSNLKVSHRALGKCLGWALTFQSFPQLIFTDNEQTNSLALYPFILAVLRSKCR